MDPDDKTPLAIKNTGAGNCFCTEQSRYCRALCLLLSYYNEKYSNCRPARGVLYAKRTIFDLALPRMMADDKITAEGTGRIRRRRTVLKLFPSARSRIAVLENKEEK